MSTQTETSYDEIARTTLAKCGGSIKIRLANVKPAPWVKDESKPRNHYRVQLTGPAGAYCFDFWDSISATEKGEKASVYDVLSCLQWYTPERFKDFCDEFGYSFDSREAHKRWKACLKQSHVLQRCFPNEQAREELADIR